MPYTAIVQALDAVHVKVSRAVETSLDLNANLRAPVLLRAEPSDDISVATVGEKHLEGPEISAAGLRENAKAGVLADAHEQAMHRVSFGLAAPVHAIDAYAALDAQPVIDVAGVFHRRRPGWQGAEHQSPKKGTHDAASLSRSLEIGRAHV